jgi:hypothetical protein
MIIIKIQPFYCAEVNLCPQRGESAGSLPRSGSIIVAWAQNNLLGSPKGINRAENVTPSG